MDSRRATKLSKFLSLVLRHEPQRIGISLDEAGWIDVDALLRACAAHGTSMTRDELNEVVATSDKKRFGFDESGTRIRANQGHSVEVQLGYEQSVPPDVLYHGTVERSLSSILSSGLQKMDRHHVHLSPTIDAARVVGARRGQPIILKIAARRMHDAGHVLVKSANDVWLVDEVPTEFIEVEK